jgi:preprotein translocase subunit YajC
MTSTVLSASDFVLAMTPPPGSDQPAWLSLLPFAAVLAIFYFIILLPMRKRQKKVSEFQGALKVGDRVITTAGIYGTITKVNDTSVQLQIAEKVKIEVAKAAIGGFQGQEPVVPEQGSGL